MKGAVDAGALHVIWLASPKRAGACRRDESRRSRRRCLGGTPLSGVSLRPSGRTPPGSRKNCQTDGPPPFSGSAEDSEPAGHARVPQPAPPPASLAGFGLRLIRDGAVVIRAAGGG